MSASQPKGKNPVQGPSNEPKARGANRSTKVAGKLKVLPDQPEPVPKEQLEPPVEPPRRRDEHEGSATAGDSEEEEGEDEDDTEDAQVCYDYA